MEEFRSLYLRLCKEHSIDPQDSILSRIENQSSGDNGTLDLSNHTLELSTCAVLSKLFSYDLPVVSVVLSDCMLSEECAKHLLSGLSRNTVVKELDLRGNNFRRIGAEALGNFLKNNHTLETLALEWNALGVWEVSFAAFCDGLAVNSSLIHLDLKNNQIDHVAAQELALSLRNNCTLQTLDLNWNNVGLVGGRALAEALKKNHTLNKISVTGNNIPKDVLSAIESSTLHNEDRAHLTMSSLHKTKTLTQEIEFLKSEKKKQMIGFMDDIEMTREQLDATSKASSNKINQLQVTLEERKSALNALRAKLDMNEASLTISEQRNADQAALLEICRRDNQELVKSYEAQIARERSDSNSVKTTYQQDLEQTQTTLATANSTINDLERKVKYQQDQINLLKENLAQQKSEHRISMTTADERLSSERRRMQAEMREQEEMKMQEVERMQAGISLLQQQADQKAERARLSREALEQEVAEIKARFAQERIDHDDSLRSMRKQLKDEEKFQTEQLQEKTRCLQADKAELQKRVAELSGGLAEAEAAKTASNAQLESMRRTVDGLQKVLGNKDDESEEKVARVRKELERRIAGLEEEASKSGSLREKIVCLETRLSEQAAAHRQTVNERDKELDRLGKTIRALEADAERAREDESRRAAALQAAMCSYIQGAGARQPASPVKL